MHRSRPTLCWPLQGYPADPLNARFTQTVGTGVLANEEAQDLKGRIAPSAVINEGGQTIGLVGVTTQILESISSPTGAEILGFPFGAGANGETNDMALLAAQLQPVIDDLRAQGVNKIILLSHLQQITFERQLAPLLNGVDIILAAGSNTRLGDARRRCWPASRPCPGLFGHLPDPHQRARTASRR